MRRSTLLWSILCLAVVIGLFVVKHRVQDLEDRLHVLNAEILANRDATQVLEAEWSYLNQPARLEALSRKLLGMEPPSADQTLTLDEFRLHAVPPEELGTAIADVAPNTGPATKKPPKAAPKSRPGQLGGDDWLAPILAGMKKDQ